MRIVRDIMSTELVVVSPQLSLRELVELLADKHLGGAPVVRGGRVVGVVPLDDIMLFQASLPPVPVDSSEGIAPEPETAPAAGEDEADSAFFVDLWPDAEAELPERAAAQHGP